MKIDLLVEKIQAEWSLWQKLWIKHFKYSNLLYARVTQAITNYASIEEYYLRFLLKKSFNYLYRSYLIKTRYHILYDCRRFTKYWNLIRNIISQLVAFLEFNPRDFSLYESITWQLLFMLQISLQIYNYGIVTSVLSLFLIWMNTWKMMLKISCVYFLELWPSLGNTN